MYETQQNKINILENQLKIKSKSQQCLNNELSVLQNDVNVMNAKIDIQASQSITTKHENLQQTLALQQATQELDQHLILIDKLEIQNDQFISKIQHQNQIIMNQDSQFQDFSIKIKRQIQELTIENEAKKESETILESYLNLLNDNLQNIKLIKINIIDSQTQPPYQQCQMIINDLQESINSPIANDIITSSKEYLQSGINITDTNLKFINQKQSNLEEASTQTEFMDKILTSQQSIQCEINTSTKSSQYGIQNIKTTQNIFLAQKNIVEKNRQQRLHIEDLYLNRELKFQRTFKVIELSSEDEK
ncbi:hypothetical protein SS50377_26590 [Spironucleus salmonicida]|nr:hypothetical protein SS50377_26590 [Spironucleus salmonicida]